MRFRQKPMLDLVVCVGHYPFTKEAVEQYFPERGTFKIAALPRIAQICSSRAQII